MSDNYEVARLNLEKYEGVGKDSEIIVKLSYGGLVPEFTITLGEFLEKYLEWRDGLFYGFKRGVDRLSVLTPRGFIGIKGAILNPSSYLLDAKFTSPQDSGRKITSSFKVTCGVSFKDFNKNGFIKILDLDSSVDLDSLKSFERDCRGLHVRNKLSRLREIKEKKMLLDSFVRATNTNLVTQDISLVSGLEFGESINLVLESTVYESYYAGGIEIKASKADF